MTSSSTPSKPRLVITSRDSSYLAGGIVFLGVALLFWLYRPLLVCDHGLGTCTLNAYDMPGNPQLTFTIASVKSAQIQTRTTGVESSESRVVLLTQDRPRSIDAAWSTDPLKARTMASRIDRFLTREAPETLRLIPFPGMHIGSAVFLGIALALLLAYGFFRRSCIAIFDPEQNYYQIETRRGQTRRSISGKTSQITGTLDKAAGGGQRRRSQLGVLDSDCRFSPVMLPTQPGSRKQKASAAKICRLLALDDSRALRYWDLKPTLAELARSVGGPERQQRELSDLDLELQSDPDNLELLRQIALRLKRLGRSEEASARLRGAHGRWMATGKAAEANRLAGIIWTMNL